MTKSIKSWQDFVTGERTKYKLPSSKIFETCGQFHQHSMPGFFVWKFYAQFFCTKSFRILAQKLLKKCWWNWHSISQFAWKKTLNGMEGNCYKKTFRFLFIRNLTKVIVKLYFGRLDHLTKKNYTSKRSSLSIDDKKRFILISGL